MGYDLGAAVVYGINIGGDFELPRDEEIWLAENFCNLSEPGEFCDDMMSQFKKYWDERRKALAEFDVKLYRSLWCDQDLGTIVCLSSLIQEFDGPEVLDISKLVVPGGSDQQKLKRVALALGYTGDCQCNWYVVPRYF